DAHDGPAHLFIDARQFVFDGGKLRRGRSRVRFVGAGRRDGEPADTAVANGHEPHRDHARQPNLNLLQRIQHRSRSWEVSCTENWCNVPARKLNDLGEQKPAFLPDVSLPDFEWRMYGTARSDSPQSKVGRHLSVPAQLSTCAIARQNVSVVSSSGTRGRSNLPDRERVTCLETVILNVVTADRFRFSRE